MVSRIGSITDDLDDGREAGTELVAAARLGSGDAFDVLVVRYAPGVRRFLTRFVGDADLADDLSQDTFWLAYRRLDTLLDDRRFAAWLYRIARNRAISHLRRERLRRTVSLDLISSRVWFHHSASRPPDIDAVVTEDVIQHAIDRLSSAERDAVLLHSVAGFNTNEVADILGISAAAAGRRISRGKDRFRRAYEELVDDTVPKGMLDLHA